MCSTESEEVVNFVNEIDASFVKVFSSPGPNHSVSRMCICQQQCTILVELGA